MRVIPAAIFSFALACAGAASAQSTGVSADPRAGENAAIKSPESTGLPSKGAYSFTKKQAAERFAKAGYASVKDLDKDKDGLRRGSSSKDGKPVEVSLDFKGNVNAQ